MKKIKHIGTLIIAAAVMLCIVYSINSCGSTSKKEYGTEKGDTIRTLALYKFKNQLHYDVIGRIRKRVEKFVPVDNNTQKKQWAWDTLYIINWRDTARDANRNPRLDSTGKAIMENQLWGIGPADVYIDGGKNVDSILNEFSKQFVKQNTDSTKKK